MTNQELHELEARARDADTMFPSPSLYLELADAIAALRADKAKLVEHLTTMLGAIDGGAVDSLEADVGDSDIPPHKFHEEWAARVVHYLKQLDPQ